MKVMIILLCSVFFKPIAHDVAIAIFTIKENSEGLQLEVILSTEDLCTELSISAESVSESLLKKYLCEHFALTLDDDLVTIDKVQFVHRQDHLSITAKFEKSNGIKSTLQIKNTCLLSIPDHSNIIQLELSGDTRDFRMSKSRQVIEVTYSGH